jgi:hypothetical protein
MTGDERRINPIERSLLMDLVGLYTCDLSREFHQKNCDENCIACSKQAIITAIDRYRRLDAELKIVPAPASLATVPDD